MTLVATTVVGGSEMAIENAVPRGGGRKNWRIGIDYSGLVVSQQEREEEREYVAAQRAIDHP